MQMVLLLTITFMVLAFKVSDRLETTKIDQPGWTELNALASNLKELSKPGDLFMMLVDENFYNISIPRKAERDVYYLYRCIPSQTRIIYEWYCRGLEQNKVKANINYLEQSGLDKKIDFIVSSGDLNTSFLEQVYNSDNYRIYKIKHEN